MKEFLKSLDFKVDTSILTHRYKDFKKTEQGKSVIEEYVKRWNKIGLTERLSGTVEEECALAFEQTATFLLANEDNTLYEKCPSIETIIFPIVRRLIVGYEWDDAKYDELKEDVFSFKDFIKYLKEIDYKSLIDLIDSIAKIVNRHIDYEQEISFIVSEILVLKFNNDDVTLEEASEKIKETIRNKYIK